MREKAQCAARQRGEPTRPPDTLSSSAFSSLRVSTAPEPLTNILAKTSLAPSQMGPLRPDLTCWFLSSSPSARDPPAEKFPGGIAYGTQEASI